MRSIKPEGAVAQRRKDECDFALHTLGAALRETLVGVELRDQALEGAPEGVEACCAVGEAMAGREAVDAVACVGEFAGAQVDQQVELGVGVGQGGGDLLAVGGICGEGFDVEIVGEDREADFDDVAQVHLQRLNGAEAPEDTQDDLPERFHGGEYRLRPGPGRIWGELSYNLSG